MARRRGPSAEAGIIIAILLAVVAFFVWLFKTLNLSIVGNIAAAAYIIFISNVWYRTEWISEPEWLAFA